VKVYQHENSYWYQDPISATLNIPNSDFWIVTAILSACGGLGIWEAYEAHPIFYTQSGILFGAIGFLAYRVFWLERRNDHTVLSSSNAV
jgi:hypothetical protein